jgi:hypothetical protein
MKALRKTRTRTASATTLDGLSWHDGVLLEWRFVPGDGVRGLVELLFALYPDQIESSERNLVAIRCEGVHRFLVSCDAGELEDNAWAGNVQDGHQRGSVLQVLLTGGYIEVEAASFTLPRTNGSASGRRRGWLKRGVQLRKRSRRTRA